MIRVIFNIVMFGSVVSLIDRKKLIKNKFLKVIKDLVILVVLVCLVNNKLKISVLRLFLIFINLNIW